MKCVATIYGLGDSKLATICAETNIDTRYSNKATIQFENTTITSEEFVKVWNVYREILRCI